MRYATDAMPQPRYDYATGLFSRWCLEARTDEELSSALRRGRQVMLAVVAAEPRSRARLVHWLDRELGAGDIAGVVCPGVFAIMLPEDDHAGGARIADRAGVSRMIEGARTDIGGGLQWGIAAFPEDGLTFEKLLRHAVLDMTMECVAA